jgi:DNA-binding CsgD family transcriptional regulator
MAAPPPPALRGRASEREALDRLLESARAGRSAVLVLRGEAGVGKTALLRYAARQASDFRLAEIEGVEAEMELPFAGLHQLCAPMLDALPAIPEHQQAALRVALGLAAGEAPDRFLVALAALGLLSSTAERRPLLCLVDDAQWLDPASAEALGSVAGRLTTERVALVFAVREPTSAPVLTRLPELVLRGLDRTDAAVLLDAAVTFALDPRVRGRILAESRGNPRALLELARTVPPAQLAFGGAADDRRPQLEATDPVLPGGVPALPEQSRRLLLLAAAEPVGDVSLLMRAADRLGIPSQAVVTAERSGAIEVQEVVRFRHPLDRPAVYRAATPSERRVVHRALAEVTDADGDPGRRAWHRARAAAGPDESVAEELERALDRALADGGLASAAAFLEQAAALAHDPAHRVRRALRAAEYRLLAGGLDEACALLAAVRAEALRPPERARVDLLQARIALGDDGGKHALPLLLTAARRLEPFDGRLARGGYLDALSAALLAGRLAAGRGARQVSDAVGTAGAAPGGDEVLDALSAVFADGYEAAAAHLRRALRGPAGRPPGVDEALRAGWPAAVAASSLWDDESWEVLTRRHLAVARRTGALRVLPLALHGRATFHLLRGNLVRAASLGAESRALATTASDLRLLRYTELGVLAFRGLEEKADPLFRRCLDDAVARGEGYGVAVTQWARAVLDNGLGRYHSALAAAQAASEPVLELGPAVWALAEAVEAGVHAGRADAATSALERLSGMTRASGTGWALGVEASRRALLESGDTADALHREAIRLLTGTAVRVELARARLLYGEWLRREGRRVDARAQLRRAQESFRRMGLEAFADRAGRELLATGETVRRRTTDSSQQLTAQEGHIAQLVVDGRTNPEIAAALFISPRTVEWHLRRIFAKVDVRSRRELSRALTQPG